MDIQARFVYDKFDHSKESAANLVLTLKAPMLDWVQKRPSICILPVVDLSGSMKGAKLDYAKKSLLKLIDHLQEGDFTGLIGFESRVHVLVQPQEVTSDFKLTMKKAVEDMRVLGGTNFSEGMLKALSVVQGLDLSQRYLKRVILFTDGQPTEGIIDPVQILRLLNEQKGSISVSAFGYGSTGGGSYGGCDPDFLTKVSDTGQGNFAYVKDPDDALTAFAKELGGLLSTYATDLNIELEPVKSNSIVKLVTNVGHEVDGLGSYDIPVSNILSEETRHFVFETKLAEQSKALPRPVAVFSVRVKYNIVSPEGKKETKTVETKARVQFVRPTEAATAVEDRTLGEIVALHRMIRAQLEAEELAKKGSFQEAANFMATSGALAESEGYLGVAVAANAIGTRLRSRVDYARSGGFLRSVSNGVTRSYGVSSMDSEAAAVTSTLGGGQANAAMDLMVESFTTNSTEGLVTPAVVPPAGRPSSSG